MLGTTGRPHASVRLARPAVSSLAGLVAEQARLAELTCSRPLSELSQVSQGNRAENLKQKEAACKMDRGQLA